MGNKKTLLLIACLFMFSFSCFAKQLSFQIVQHDGSNPDVTEQSLVFEDEIFDEFFNWGYIVTNSEASISTSDEDDKILWSMGVKEAIEGSSDYFIQVKLYYELSDDGRVSKLTKIEWSLTAVKTGDILTTRSMKISSKNTSINELIDISVLLVDDIKKSLIA